MHVASYMYQSPGHICDQAWENRPYLHVKFDPNFSLQNAITHFCQDTILTKISPYMQKIPKDFNKTYRILDSTQKKR